MKEAEGVPMGEQKDRWTWEVPGFEPRKPLEQDNRRKHGVPQQNRQGSATAALTRRYSISTASVGSHPELSKASVGVKLQKLKDQVKVLPLLPLPLISVLVAVHLLETFTSCHPWRMIGFMD